MDKDLFYISLVLVIIGVGGQLTWFFFAVHGGTNGQPTQASFQEIQNISGYMMVLGLIILPAGLFKDGLPSPGPGAKVFIGLVLVIIVGLAFTTIILIPSSSTRGPPPNGFLTILPGSSNPGTPITFSPQNVTVIIGKNNTVQWTNNDNAPHTVTFSSAPSGVSLYNSGTILSGQTTTYTFSTPGVYNYYCTFHPSWMKGTVTVKLSG